MPFFSRGRAKLSRLHVNSFGAGGGPLPPPIPPNGLVFYDFKQSDLTKAITEIVRGEQVLQTTRAADLNVVQSSSPSVISYGANTAGFDVGVGMLVEKEGTNLLRYATALGDNPAVWQASGGLAVLSTTELAPDGTNTATLFNMPPTDTEPYLRQQFAWTAQADKATVSFWAKAANSAGIGADMQTRNIRFDDGVVTNQGVKTWTLTGEWQRYVFEYEAKANTTDWQLRPIFKDNGEDINVLLWGVDLVAGNATSPIYSGAGPATRDATIAEISTFLDAANTEKWPTTDVQFSIDAIDKDDLPDLQVDTEFTLGGRSDGDWLNGIKLPNLMTMAAGSTIGSGKWLGLLPPALDGSTITAGGIELIIDVANVNTFAFTNPSGASDADIQAAFEAPNKITLDTSTSAITKGELAAVRAELGDLTTLLSISNAGGYETNIIAARDLSVFTHGDDSVSAAAPDLEVVASISSTDITLNGVRLSRSDLRNNDFSSVCTLGSAAIYERFTVQSPIPAPPPVVSELIVEDISALIGVSGASGFAPADFFDDDPVGSLTPGQLISGRELIAIYSNETGGEGKLVFLIPDDSFDAPKVVVASFNGDSFTFTPDVFGSPTADNVASQNDELFDILADNQSDPIQFEIVSVEDYVVSGFGDDFGEDF